MVEFRLQTFSKFQCKKSVLVDSAIIPTLINLQKLLYDYEVHNVYVDETVLSRKFLFQSCQTGPNLAFGIYKSFMELRYFSSGKRKWSLFLWLLQISKLLDYLQLYVSQFVMISGSFITFGSSLHSGYTRLSCCCGTSGKRKWKVCLQPTSTQDDTIFYCFLIGKSAFKFHWTRTNMTVFDIKVIRNHL